MSQNTLRVERRYTQRLQARRRTVFPLLCPVREYEWIGPWRCDLLYSQSGVAELDCVFTTESAGQPSYDVWVVTRSEPNRLVCYFCFVLLSVFIFWRNRRSETLAHSATFLGPLGFSRRVDVPWLSQEIVS